MQFGTVSFYLCQLEESSFFLVGIHTRPHDNIYQHVRFSKAFYLVSHHPFSISSVMISRLVLNLRHPSLVSNARRSSQPDLTDDPSLTFTGRPGTTGLSEEETILRNNTRRPYHLA